ncbi:DUF4328 domain-containing protein [Streptomyces gamaensis]|uniref:DUF4328 domain-containing protein n=1 Tax=Streptomyces gamaensis TaxID=1763542 RepID=A0ABW0YSD6_9ACTN
MYPCGHCRAAAVGPDGRCAACGAFQQQAAVPPPQPGPYGQPGWPAQQLAPYPYGPPGMPVGGVDLRRGVRIALMVMLGVSAAVLLAQFAARCAQFSSLQGLLDHGIEDSDSIASEADRADAFAGVATLLLDLAVIATAVLWAVWLRRARINAELFAPGTHRFGTGWAAGAWFTPVVNLWFPKQIVNDIYRASTPPGPKGPPRALANAWWTLWIASGVLYVMAGFRSAFVNVRIMNPRYDGSHWRDDVTALKGATALAGGASLLLAVAGVLGLLVVRQLAGLQERRAASGPAPGAGLPYGGAGVPHGPAGYPPVQPQPGPGWPGPAGPPPAPPTQNPYGPGPAQR